MRGDKVWMIAFVDFDDGESPEEAEKTGQLNSSVDVGSQDFMAWSGGWLKNESCLYLKKKCRNTEELEFVDDN